MSYVAETLPVLESGGSFYSQATVYMNSFDSPGYFYAMGAPTPLSSSYSLYIASQGPDWKSAIDSASEWITIYESPDHNTLRIRKVPNGSYYSLYLYVNDTSWAYIDSTYSSSRTKVEFGFCKVIDGPASGNYGFAFWLQFNNRNDRGIVGFFGRDSDQEFLETLLDNAFPVTYVWKPFNQLNGNSGQFRMNLTMINEDHIGDYTQTSIAQDLSEFDRISTQSSLLPYFQNCTLGNEETIAWAGQNYMTMTAVVDTAATAYDQYKITLKFYYQSGTLAYSQDTFIRYPQGTTYSLIYPMLSFIYDEDEEAAVLDPVYYYQTDTPGVPQTITYWYGSMTGYDISPSDQDMYELWVWLHGVDVDWSADDPYDAGTEDNGGDGGNPRPQDDLESPDVPTVSGLNVNFVTIYNPSVIDLEEIADFMWSDNVLNNFKKYFNNFADNLIGLYILPYTPSNLPTKPFTVGKMTDSNLPTVPYLTDRYVKIDMGSYRLKPRWTSYLDYSPYTKIHIYLPGIGVQALDTDDLMSPTKKDGTLDSDQGCLLQLEYMLDLYTGLVVAYLYTTVNNRKSMKYQFSGKVGSEIPLTGSDRTNMIKGLIGLAAGAAGAVAMGGLSAPMVAAAPAVAAGDVAFGTKMASHMSGAAGGLASSAVAGTVNAMKPEVYRSGNMTGDVSMLSYPTPYLIISSPNKPRLVNQAKFTGYPSYKSGNLNEFSGFTQVIEVHVEGIPCSEVEREMIISMLKDGVIL